MRISDWSSDVCSSDLQGLAQPHFVEVAGEVVEVGKVFEAFFLLLAQGDQADDAGHACRRAGRREFHRAAVVQPLELALPRAQAKLAIEGGGAGRSEEHTSELQSLMRISYAVFCLKKKNTSHKQPNIYTKQKRNKLNTI